MAEYGVVCANLSHDYREAVGYNLRRNKARLVKRGNHDKLNHVRPVLVLSYARLRADVT